MIRKLLPEPVKRGLRLIKYGHERKRFFPEIEIKKKQDELIRKTYDPNTENLIVFIIMGGDKLGKEKISGGTISIVSICEESLKFKNIHHSEVMMCTMKDESLLTKHLLFDNNVDVFRFEQLYTYFKKVKRVIIHLPEFMVGDFIITIPPVFKSWLKKMENVHINVLNQNIKLMPKKEVILQLKTLANKVTSTTAHQKYSTASQRDHYEIPIHKFSAWVAPEQYRFRTYGEKENLIIVSPDQHAYRGKVLNLLHSIKGLEVVVIQNMTYNQFKEIISRAKWSLTFGEGLDGYIVEPIFSGAIGFAVYNEEFFTPDFAQLKTIYPSFDALIEKIEIDLQSLDNEESYASYQQQQFDLCRHYYNYQQYKNNIAAFYREEYTFA